MEMMSSVRNENSSSSSSSSRFPFTSNQWQELEHQALVYKYMISGMPIPPHLLFSIQTSLDSSTQLFLHQHSPLQSIGWKCFEMGFGRKIDPEPGRCRRTDGKKWRCSKEAYPDSKYCERHMHRGRNRSRKPVEVVVNNNKLSPNYPSPKTTSSSLSSLSSTSRCGNVMSSQHLLESSLYSQKYITSYGMKEDVDERRFLAESCGIASMGDSWPHLEPLTMNNSSSSLSLLAGSKQRSFSDYRNDCLYQGRCYDELALKIERKGEPEKVTHHFFDESPHKDTDSSTTQLSISIPSRAHDFFQSNNDK